MAVSSLKFRIEGENSSALRSISDVKRHAHELGSELQKSIGDKLKGVFSIIAVEEMVRRTAEWSLELQQTARGLGMTGEALQTLRVMAEKAGVPTEKLFSFYSKMEAAATKAANGNAKLKASFHALGVDTNKLKGEGRYSSSELFSKTLSGALKPGGGAAIQDIYGSKNALQIGMLARETKGKSPAEYQEANKSQIIPEEDTIAMARAWDQIGDDLKSIGNKLVPIIRLVLTIVDGVLKIVNGSIGTIGKLLTPSEWNKVSTAPGVEGISRNAIRAGTVGRSAANFIPGTAAGLVSLATLGNYNPKWKWMNSGAETYGNILSEEGYREAEGLGEGLSNIATFGVGTAARALGMGAKGAGAAGEMLTGGRAGAGLGRLGKKIGATGSEGGRYGGGGLVGKGGDVVYEKLYQRKLNSILKSPRKLSKEGLYVDASGNYRFKETGGIVSKEEVIDYVNESIWNELGYVKNSESILGNIGSAGTLISAGQIGADDIANSEMFKGEGAPPPDRRGALSKIGQGGAGGPGSSNLAIGGVFGVDIQSKIVALNGQMVDLLQQIVENTTPDIDSGGSEDEGAGL